MTILAVPTIDLHRPPGEAAEAITASCRDLGFFQIVGHGLDHEVVDATWDTATQFFELPPEEKLALRIRPGEAYGYTPFLGERLAASLGDQTPPDLKESFASGPLETPPAALEDDSSRFVY